MDSRVGYVLAFVGGAAISSFITWKIADKYIDAKYEARYQEEVKSVKERFTVPRPEKKELPKKEEDDKESIAKVALDKSSITEYYKQIKPYVSERTYYSNTEVAEAEKAKFVPKDLRIEVIKPDDFDNEEDFEKQELTLYADGTLADEDDTVLNPLELVGDGTLDRMGEYEDGAMYVKNYGRKVVYQILEDRRYYEDVTGKVPHLPVDEEGE